MANYYASERTNYFQVKDADAFIAWAETLDAHVVKREGVGIPTMFSIYPENSEDGTFPTSRYNEETEDYDDLDFLGELAEHLIPGSVAVLMHAGAEKLRYIQGFATAIDSTGKTIQISLDDIYDKALAEFGVKPTRAEY